MIDIIKNFWVKLAVAIITGSFLTLTIASISFMVDIKVMMKQYQVDKMYTDKDRKELSIAVLNLSNSVNQNKTDIAILKSK